MAAPEETVSLFAPVAQVVWSQEGAAIAFCMLIVIVLFCFGVFDE